MLEPNYRIQVIGCLPRALILVKTPRVADPLEGL